MKWDWQSDLEANSLKRGLLGAVKAFFLDPSFTFVVWMRLFLLIKNRNFIFSGVLTSIVYAHIIKTFSCEINYDINSIGKALKVPHPIGIVIGANALIGDNVTIFQNVTIGRKHLGSVCNIFIGNNTIIGAGAVILGPVKISNNVIIGANSVVLNDVLENSTIVGSPARVVDL